MTNQVEVSYWNALHEGGTKYYKTVIVGAGDIWFYMENWGPKGKAGQRKVYVYQNAGNAKQAFNSRKKSKVKRGYTSPVGFKWDGELMDWSKMSKVLVSETGYMKNYSGKDFADLRNYCIAEVSSRPMGDDELETLKEILEASDRENMKDEGWGSW